MNIELTSSGDASGFACGIMIDGEEKSFLEKGLNFLILDKEDGSLISRAFYGYNDEEKLLFKSETFSAEAAKKWKAVIEEGDYYLSSGNGGAETVISIRDAGNGSYSIAGKESDLRLSPDNGGNTEGVKAEFNEASGLAGEDFFIIPDEKGGYGFYSLYNGLMLSSDGNPFTMKKYSGQDDESFKLRKAV